MTGHTVQASARVLLLPGWLDSGPGHWQTLWEAQAGCQRVVQDDWVWPKRGDWMARLEETLLADPQPALLAAHSLGCHLVAAWAAHSRHRNRVSGALLVAPPDLDRADLLPHLSPWRPVLRQPLGLPALLVYSDDDPYCDSATSRQLAADWALPTWALGRHGHINAESGLGDWPEGLTRLRALAPQPS